MPVEEKEFFDSYYKYKSIIAHPDALLKRCDITICSADDERYIEIGLDIETAEAFVDHLETCIAEAKIFRDSKNEKS